MSLTLEIRNFRVLRRTMWTPAQVSVLAGANGAGKTTLLGVLNFLRHAFLWGVSTAVSHEDLVGAYGIRSWGSSTEEPVVLAVALGDIRWELQLVFRGPTLDERPGERVTRGAEVLLARAPLSDRVAFGGNSHLADNRLGLRAVIDAVQPPELGPLAEVLTSLRIHRGYDLNRFQYHGSHLGGELRLDPSGQDAFTVLRNWRDRRELRPQYEFVLSGLRRAFPDAVVDLDFQVAGMIVTGDWIISGSEQTCPTALVPSGWLTALLHLTAVAGAPPGGFLAIDEFENSLHPYAIRQLVSAIRGWAADRDLKVCLTTHSPVLLDEFKDHPEAVFVMEGENRPVPLTELYDEDWLARFSLGRLYAHGEFGGQLRRNGQRSAPSGPRPE